MNTNGCQNDGKLRFIYVYCWRIKDHKQPQCKFLVSTNSWYCHQKKNANICLQMFNVIMWSCLSNHCTKTSLSGIYTNQSGIGEKFHFGMRWCWCRTGTCLRIFVYIYMIYIYLNIGVYRRKTETIACVMAWLFYVQSLIKCSFRMWYI